MQYDNVITCKTEPYDNCQLCRINIVQPAGCIRCRSFKRLNVNYTYQKDNKC